MLTDRWNAKDYARNSSAQEAWADELISKLNLAGNENGIDIGCGDGRITAKISNLLANGKMVGIDQSRSMIELANTSFSSNNLVFYEMNAMDIELSEKFDFAFSNATLHWIKDHRKVLVELRKCLRAGAKIVFQMGGRGNAGEMIAAFDYVMRKEKWRDLFEGFQSPYSFYDVDCYSIILPGSGYVADRIELVEKVMQHDSICALKGWLRTTWFPYFEKLEQKVRELFLDEVLSTYIRNHPLDAKGATHVKMVRLEVCATAF